MVVHGYEICRADIPKYLTDHAWQAVNIWRTYKTFGLPFAGGWAEQPAIYWDVIEAIEAEAQKRNTGGKQGGRGK